MSELLDIKQETADNPYPKDCRHCHYCHREPLLGYRYAACHNTETEMVMRDVHHNVPCSIERDPKFDRINKCGSKGALWTARDANLWQRIVVRLW